jgi:acyl dehydratase
MTPQPVRVVDLPRLAGRDLGASSWLVIDQERIDAFAGTTEDHQWIHVDRERAASGPLGVTVAHGMLTLSLAVGRLLDELLVVGDADLVLNYGLDRVRFPAPVAAGSRVRLHASVADVAVQTGGTRVTVALSVELEGSEKPCCVAEEILLYRGQNCDAARCAGLR